MTEQDPNQKQEGTIPTPDTKAQKQRYKLDQLMPSDALQMATRASGGFSFAEDPNLPPERVGYTNMRTRVIYINPLYLDYVLSPTNLDGTPRNEEDIRKARREGRGFLFHEAGHHAPEVNAFQDMLLANLGNRDIIPEAYRGSPAAETRFFDALHRHLHNGLADIWDESFMGRSPYHPIRLAIDEMYHLRENPKQFYQSLSKPEQLVQLLLSEARYQPEAPIKEFVDPEVYDSYKKILGTGALRAIQDRRAFENYFASPRSHETALQRKFYAYQEVFLPEYLKLMEKELEERKEQKQQMKMQGKSGKPTSGGSGSSEAVPLTDEEMQELKDQILSELEEAGKQLESQTMSDEQKQKTKAALDAIKKALENKQGEKKGESKDNGSEEDDPAKRLQDLAKDLQRKDQERQRRGLAEAHQVRQESVLRWETIKKRYDREIDSLAGQLSDVFLEDRRKKMEYLKREGEIIPGLEYETIAALASGDTDPDTRMHEVSNPEFLETELEIIIDTSGSMMGDKIGKSVDAAVVISEGFKKVREDLVAEELVLDEEQPLRIGASKFTTIPERITELDEPIDDQKQLKMIDKFSFAGGGTDEVDTIAEVYKGLSKGRPNVIKIMMIFSDGYGNREGLAPVMRKIEEDDEIIFLVLALGADEYESQAIIESYIEPLQRPGNSNVSAIAAQNVNDIIPGVTSFLKKEVEKRRTR